MNIVKAMNEVLTKHFKCDCFLTEYRLEVATEVIHDTVLQGICGTRCKFYAEQEVSQEYLDKNIDGAIVVLYKHKTQSNVWEYEMEMLYQSKLRKKLLKAMLEYN